MHLKTAPIISSYTSTTNNSQKLKEKSINFTSLHSSAAKPFLGYKENLVSKVNEMLNTLTFSQFNPINMLNRLISQTSDEERFEYLYNKVRTEILREQRYLFKNATSIKEIAQAQQESKEAEIYCIEKYMSGLNKFNTKSAQSNISTSNSVLWAYTIEAQAIERFLKSIASTISERRVIELYKEHYKNLMNKCTEIKNGFSDNSNNAIRINLLTNIIRSSDEELFRLNKYFPHIWAKNTAAIKQ